MKRALVVAIFMACTVYAQEPVDTTDERGTTLIWQGRIMQPKNMSPIEQARADSICIVRGHVSDGLGSTTLMMGVTRYLDLEDRTLLIQTDPNATTYMCLRCLRDYTVGGTIDTTVVWKKE